MLLDVDGTLYHQRRLRIRTGYDLVARALAGRSLRTAGTTLRSIGVFRRVREELRALGHASESLELEQYARAARRAGVPPDVLQAIVEEWIFDRPLRHMTACRREGLEDFLALLAARGVPAGLFSDYPVAEKARALGIASGVSLSLCATDAAINAFKPDPRGFLHAARAWRLDPAEVVYVGDRPEVDAVGAAAAGMPCAILTRRAAGVLRDRFGTYLAVRSFLALADAIRDRLPSPGRAPKGSG